MKEHLLAGIVITALAAGPAMAAGMPVKASAYKAPPAGALYNWTGVYVGANVGYGWRDGSVDFAPGNAAATDFFTAIGGRRIVPDSITTKPGGFLGGIQFGYNYQFGNFVFGVETDLVYSAIRGNASVAVPGTPGGSDPFATSAEQKLDWFGTFRGRFGIAHLDRSLFYATGGLAYGKAKLSTSILDLNPATPCGPFGLCASATSTKQLVGWTVGGGWEYAFADRASVKAEYLYYDLGSISHAFFDLSPALAPVPVFTATADFKGHIVRVGLNYKFGGPAAVVANY